MSLTPLDWIVLVVILAVPLGVGVLHYRRAGSSVGQFFLSGRELPWWLAGTSMVATTFAADTPLAVTGLVAANGVAGNWLWWNAALGSMLTVFFFARLWRRAGILTDVEFAELRYAGRTAAFLRGFRALYLGLPVNCLIIGWVNLALAKILSVTLGWDRLTAVFVGLAATGCYAALAGLRGVVVTDFIQFGIALLGTGALAVLALRLPAIGGLDGLMTQLPESTFRLWPAVEASGATAAAAAPALPLASFVAYLGVQWWASWYPGQEPGGGGYVAQRMMSAKDERHAVLSALWFTVAHYCLRPWPWILVALASLVLHPDLADREAGYAMVMRDHLPSGWRGLLVGAFFAAYMSTVSTQLNWGNLVPGERLLCPVRPAGGRRGASGHRVPDRYDGDDAGQCRGDLLPRQRAPGVGVHPRVGRRHRPRAHPAVVLVAGDSCVGNRRARGGRSRLPLRAGLHHDRLPYLAPLPGALDDRLLACRDLARAGRTAAAPDRVLSARTPRGGRVAPRRRGSQRAPTGAGDRGCCGAGGPDVSSSTAR